MRMPIEIHIHVHYEGLAPLVEKIVNIQTGVNTIMIDEVKAAIAEVKANVEEIDGDLQEVIDKINSTPGDGMTGAEVEEVLALLGDLKGLTRATADKVPEPPTA